MNESWKQWEGQVIDGTFHLRQYLGGSGHSAVYLTEFGEREPQTAAIKLVPLDAKSAELALSRWAFAAKLSHSNLLRIFQSGCSQIGTTELIYVVTEYAEEDLSQILPQRALTPEEARGMLDPVLDALLYLHGKGVVHGHIKTANVMAVADQLKISSDGICTVGDSTVSSRQPSPYDPPEATTTGISFAGDVWSLGTTLVEVLTQRLPVWDPAGISDPELPATSPEILPQPFLDIARHALQRDPQRRWTLGDIAARLQPNAKMPPSPLAVPLSPIAPLPVSNRQTADPQTNAQQKPPQRTPPQPAAHRAKNSFSIPHYLIPAVAVALILAVILAVPKLLNHRPEPRQASTIAPDPSTMQAKAQPKLAPSPSNPLKTANSPKPTNSLQTKTITTADAKPNSPTAVPAPALLHSEKKLKTTAAGPGRGEVLDQVLPDVSAKARDTIRGTVRVSIRVQVDRSGSVIASSLGEPAPSQFFADLALQAARGWTFQPPEADGHAVSSEWLLRFYFTPSATKAIPEQVAP